MFEKGIGDFGMSRGYKKTEKQQQKSLNRIFHFFFPLLTRFFPII
jgi:hypothetical protein